MTDNFDNYSFGSRDTENSENSQFVYYPIEKFSTAAENAAEDFFAVETAAAANKKSRSKSRAVESRLGSVLMMIFISILAVLLLGGVIYSLDKRNTVYNQVAELKNELKLAEAENARLQTELDSEMSAKNVEDYAENVLGMKKIDPSQIEYVKTQMGDVVSIPEKEDGILTKIKNFFDECVEYFKG